MTRNSFVLLLAAAAPALAAPKPKLVVALTIDQFRYDYLVRFRGDYTAGLDRLLTKGAVFTNAHYDHFPSVTAVGHSTFLTGAYPATSGIIANDWFDLASGKSVTSVSDEGVKLLGGSSEGASSPRRLLVSTLGDEVKMANGGKTRVIGISMKDRSAILPVGHMADAAYWVERKTGAFVSSTYYFNDLPAWVKDFNASKPADKYAGAVWSLAPYAERGYKLPAAGDARLYDSVTATPFGNELLELFAERALAAEQMGKRDTTDILALSLSSNDYIGHDKGPDSPEVHSVSVHTDKLLAKFFQFLDQQVGMDNVLVILTADHGVAPLPEVTAARKMPGGRMPLRVIQDTVQKALEDKYGKGKWILSPSEHSLYFNRELIQQKRLEQRDVQRVAAEAALTVAHVARVYTRDQLTGGVAMEDAIGRRIMNGYHHARGADVMIVLEPYWMYASRGTTHGTPYGYDTHVPVIFMGAGVKAGRYPQRIIPNDIAPTLAYLLEVEPPSGAAGRILTEILQ
ncbi:MAG: alkaline phosphatase family protein [Candidatus Solibacter usitatus]|nr:alkaline phosphatase family protein [Candidatus Solibacter usitatus]